MAYREWVTLLAQPLSDLLQEVTGFLPNVLKAAAFLLTGWIVGRILKALTGRGLSRLYRLLYGLVYRVVPRRMMRAEGERIPGEWLASDVIPRVVFWVVFLMFLPVASESLNLDVISDVLNRFVQHLPSALAAVLIFFIGLVLSNVLRGVISTAAASEGIGYSSLLGEAARFGVLLLTGVIALGQIGVDSTLLVVVTATLVGALIGGAALAFGMGARTVMSNIIAMHYVLGTYRVGQHIRIGDLQGTIIAFKPTSVVLESPQGQVSVPGRDFSERVSILIPEAKHDDR